MKCPAVSLWVRRGRASRDLSVETLQAEICRAFDPISFSRGGSSHSAFSLAGNLRSHWEAEFPFRTGKVFSDSPREREELGIEGRSLLPFDAALGDPPLKVHRERNLRSPAAGNLQSEQVRTYLYRHDGPFYPDSWEILKLRFWPIEKLHQLLGNVIFIAKFEEEFA